MSRWRDYDYFPPSSPREVKGGIKAHSKRGAFTKNWWAKRWIGVLEGFNMGARLTRGRAYARRGQVISIDIDSGTVTAEVQGSRPSPYHVSIKVKTLSQAKWKKLAEILSKRASFAASLLAGEMPTDIEDAFAEAGLSLFPEKKSDLKTDCSCPDWANPCKHIAAVYYLLGEEFDRDPFLILALRGIEREKLVELIAGSISMPVVPEDAEEIVPEPLPVDPDVFWNEPNKKDFALGEVSVPRIEAALPKRLGGFPFWRSDTDLNKTLERIYHAASMTGINIVLGELNNKSGN